MGVKIINQPQLYSEDEVGNFEGIFEDGDLVTILMDNGDKYEGTIDIYSHYVEIETDEGFFNLGIDDIKSVREY